ncbi:amidohydrolase family protein [Halegenticoccus tardaugens]|uniref:amidohydrolase family protein n=1 Tax=Halegenticoccus tardaugens TaxID=2071624 RepID=UPI00100B0274|nr:amidohydrolase family protein [Halegenticoccus tardaugens]
MRCVRTEGVYHPDREVIDGTVICIERGEVVDVGTNVPAGAELIYDGQGYALPGFVDAHSHGSIRPGEGDQLGQMRADPAVQAVRAAHNLRCDLEAGTTTMRLMGCEHRLDLQLQNLERMGELTSPRLLPCGGHLTPTNGHGHAITATDGPEICRKRVRKLLAAGAHHVKYFATGGVSSTSGGLDRVPYSDAEVKTIVTEAHRQGVHVAAHAHGGVGMRQAVTAGVDTIEHAAALSADEVALLADADAHAVGTFTILYDPTGIEAGDADNPEVMAKVKEARTRSRESWERILDADIPVALGTDSMHGNLSKEVTHLVNLGADPALAIRAITSEAARAARAERAGTLEPGAHGNVVILPKHPLEDLEALANPLVVIKSGERVA